jgi:hypothetical protein
VEKKTYYVYDCFQISTSAIKYYIKTTSLNLGIWVKHTVEAVCQCNFSETTDQNFMYFCNLNVPIKGTMGSGMVYGVNGKFTPFKSCINYKNT